MDFFICTTTRRCGNRYHSDGDSTHDDDDDSENDHRKNWCGKKKILTKIAGKIKSFFTGIWNKNGVNFQKKKKLDGPFLYNQY